MIRETIFKTHEPHDGQGFKVRGHDVQRIETFSDAVFAFAVTLLIVSLEVPRNFQDLLVSMRGFFAFAICFTLLMMVWYQQHIWFRRFALDDVTTMVLNCALIFVVLFYVYPLKFLFALLFGEVIYGTGKNPFSIRVADGPLLMVIYGLGYTIIYTIFLLLYAHTLRKRGQLKLSAGEIFNTRTMIFSHTLMGAVGLGVVLLALLLPARNSGMAGYFFFIIGPAMSVLHWRRAVIRKRMIKHEV